jgi:hypothetical protein
VELGHRRGLGAGVDDLDLPQELQQRAVRIGGGVVDAILDVGDPVYRRCVGNEGGAAGRGVNQLLAGLQWDTKQFGRYGRPHDTLQASIHFDLPFYYGRVCPATGCTQWQAMHGQTTRGRPMSLVATRSDD